MNGGNYLSYIRNNLKQYTLITYLVALGSLAGLLYSIVLKLVIDEVLMKNKYFMLGKLTVILLLSFAITALINYSNGAMVLELSQNITINIKSRLLNHIQKITMEKFTQYDSGDLINRTMNDVDNISTFLSSTIIGFLANLGNAIMYLLLMLYINKKFAMIGIVMCMMQLIISRKYSPKIKVINRDIKEKNSEHLDLLAHIYKSNKFYKAYNKSEYNNEKYKKIILCIKELSFKNFKIKFLYNTTISGISFLASLVILGFGIYEIICGRMTVGTLFLFDSISEMFVQSSNAVMNFNVELQNAFVSMERIEEILKIELEDEEDILLEVNEDMPIREICFNDVCFRYSDKMILSNLSLTFHVGQSYAIMGASGRGKTTIAYLMLLFYKIQEGKILINKMDISMIPLTILREKIAFVMQESVILNSSIRENILLNASFEEESRFNDIVRICHINEFVEKLAEGYETIIGEKGRQLSEGQKQRLSIARGLIKNADVYIFDEITSHLDYETGCDILYNIQRYLKDKIIIYISHDISIKKFASSIINLQENIDGSIMEEGRCL